MKREDMTSAGAPDSGWSSYWAQGHVHSCPTSFSGFYGPNTQALWQRLAAKLVDTDRVLELGCGNGGLLTFIAGQLRAGESPRLVGVDAAELNPSAMRGGGTGDPDGAGQITLRASTPFESLEPTREFTALISQFAFEYGATEAAWAAISGAIAPRLCTTQQSIQRGARLEQVAQDEALLLRTVLAPDGLLVRASEMLPLLMHAATEEGRRALNGNPAAVAVRSHYNAAVSELIERARALTYGGYAEEVLQRLSVLLGGVPQIGISRARVELQQLDSELSAHLARLDALCASALDGIAIDQYQARLERLGFRAMSISVLSEQGAEMGWVLEGLREQ